MKNLTVTLFTVTIMLILSFKLADGQTTNNQGNATTQKVRGVDVFFYSMPVQDYTVIDEGNINILMDCNEIFTKAPKKARKAGADAVIIYPDRLYYEAIKYEGVN